MDGVSFSSSSFNLNLNLTTTDSDYLRISGVLIPRYQGSETQQRTRHSLRSLWCFIPRFLWPIFKNSSQRYSSESPSFCYQFLLIHKLLFATNIPQLQLHLIFVVNTFCCFQRLFVVSILVLFHCDHHQLNLRLPLLSHSLRSIASNRHL